MSLSTESLALFFYTMKYDLYYAHTVPFNDLSIGTYAIFNFFPSSSSPTSRRKGSTELKTLFTKALARFSTPKWTVC